MGARTVPTKCSFPVSKFASSEGRNPHKKIKIHAVNFHIFLSQVLYFIFGLQRVIWGQETNGTDTDMRKRFIAINVSLKRPPCFYVYLISECRCGHSVGVPTFGKALGILILEKAHICLEKLGCRESADTSWVSAYCVHIVCSYDWISFLETDFSHSKSVYPYRPYLVGISIQSLFCLFFK